MSKQLYTGQEVTVGKYGPPVVVVSVDGSRAVCFDLKTAKEVTYSTSLLYPI